MHVYGAMGGSLRLGSWEDVGILLHGSLAAQAGPQVLLWCLPHLLPIPDSMPVNGQVVIP